MCCRFLKPVIQSHRVHHLCVLVLGVTLVLSACTVETPPAAEDQSTPVLETIGVRLLDPPSGPGALAPNLAVANWPGAADAVLLTWLEPTDSGHALRLAWLEGENWSTPQQIATGDTFFANWADLPHVSETADGITWAHWLAKLGADTYAYGIQMAQSQDGGATWEEWGLLHDDASPTEHGFVSYAPLPNGGVQTFWLDGRAMLEGGAMQLRTALLEGASDGPKASTLLDDRVCECCATDAAFTSTGPVVVYRDRSPSEMRDIAVVRATADGWSEPALIHHDTWQIHGCPVNGPAIAADGDRVAVAWFTAANGVPKVQVALSQDGAATFGTPVLIDDKQPLGRVDIAMVAGGGAVVSWMGSTENGAEIRWRHISPDRQVGPAQVVATTKASRSAGVPRMIRRGHDLLFVWVEEGEPSSLRAGLISDAYGSVPD